MMGFKIRPLQVNSLSVIFTNRDIIPAKIMKIKNMRNSGQIIMSV
jgi:hypothetical protein